MLKKRFYSKPAVISIILLITVFSVIRIYRPNIKLGNFAFSSTLPNEAFVKNVIDGDTIELNSGDLVRYIGIDTPEVRINIGSKWELNPEDFALEAKSFNAGLVEGKKVRLEYDVEKRDKYKRLLAYVFKDNIFVNAELLRQGYAALYTFPPNVKYTEEFVKFQEEARKNSRGFWKNKITGEISPEEAKKFINEVATVKGRVLSTFKTEKNIFLNFGRDYKTDFTIVIFERSFKEFYSAEIDPETYYKDKLVSITGKIKEYNGPEIIANHPYEIKIIK
ncbi:MAG: thermonuclease family protein [bacterium]